MYHFKLYHQQLSHLKKWNFAQQSSRLKWMGKFDLYNISQRLPVNSRCAELPDVSQKSKSISDW